MKGILYIFLLSLTCFAFRKRVSYLIKKRNKDSNYLFFIRMHVFTFIFTICLSLCALAFLIGFYQSAIATNGNHNHFLTHIVTSLLYAALPLLVLGIFIPLFFIEQIEVSPQGIIRKNKLVPYSFKKFTAGNNYNCHIQIHGERKQGVYMLVKKTDFVQMKLPSSNVPEDKNIGKTIAILDKYKKNSTIIYFPRSLKIAATSFIVAAFLAFCSL